jgi:hypothetical protein
MVKRGLVLVVIAALFVSSAAAEEFTFEPPPLDVRPPPPGCNLPDPIPSGYATTSIDVPDTVYVGQIFNVTLHVTNKSVPEIVFHGPYWMVYHSLGSTFEPLDSWWWDDWLSDIHSGGSASHTWRVKAVRLQRDDEPHQFVARVALEVGWSPCYWWWGNQYYAWAVGPITVRESYQTHLPLVLQ